MNINIKATNLELTPSIKTYIEDKIGSLDKFVERFEVEGEILVTVEIARTSKHHKKGDVFYAEANVRLPNRTIRASEKGFDIRLAIDKVRDRLHRDIAKYKEKGGLTGRALRHVARMSKETMRRVLWWRNK